MLKARVTIPVLKDLRLDMERPALRGARRALEIIVARTKAGRSVNGSPLPQPKSGGAAFNRTSTLLQHLRVLSVRGRVGTIGVAGLGADGRPLSLILNSLQVGAVGGKSAGARAPAVIMGLSDPEAANVGQAMADDLGEQVVNAESQGSVFEYEEIEG